MKILNIFERKLTAPKDFSRKKYLKDLTSVGNKKPMGYLPVETIETKCGVKIEELEEYITKTGRKFVLFVDKGFFYVYDEKALSAFLNRKDNLEKLIRNKWPHTPLEFVHEVEKRFADNQEMFDLIADAFGDKKNPGRTEHGGNSKFGGLN